MYFKRLIFCLNFVKKFILYELFLVELFVLLVILFEGFEKVDCIVLFKDLLGG